MLNKRYAILTFHSALNYGAVLQTYGLFCSLCKLGLNVEVANYQPAFLVQRNNPRIDASFLSPRGLLNNVVRNGFQHVSAEPFLEFRKKWLLESKKVSTPAELEILLHDYEVIICGSDQIWNPFLTDGDISYFLPFSIPNAKKTSYAASFGVSVFPKEYSNACGAALRQFDSISVRERTAQSLVSELTSMHSRVVLDPSLLLKQEEWISLCGRKRPHQSPYVLVYSMNHDRRLLKHARKLARKEGIDVLYINDRLFKALGVNNLKSVAPETWISLLYDARYVLTNSFHGIAFSINFRKPLIYSIVKKSPTSSRISDFMDLVEVQPKGVADGLYYVDGGVPHVQSRLEHERKRSFEYLKGL